MAEAASALSVTQRHLLRLVKNGKIVRHSHSKRISKYSVTNILKDQIHEKCNMLAELSPKHLDGLINELAMRLF